MTPGGEAAASIARLECDLAAARAEVGRQRVTVKQKAPDEARAELAQQIGRTLGLVQDDTSPDLAALTQQLAAEQQQHAKQTAAELAVYRAAAGAAPDALLDSRAVAAAVADLDPTDTAAVQAAITEAHKAKPRLAAAPAGPARSGGEPGQSLTMPGKPAPAPRYEPFPGGDCDDWPGRRRWDAFKVPKV
ncbi:hypothetical protein [Streptomyces noursei]|uniref:hypothetical protein n=1 Tax=Streptomyces noursei TaxID=1971 RepID=UPI000C9ABA93|nr:hypothetical protein [Streptomyces noursei]